MLRSSFVRLFVSIAFALLAGASVFAAPGTEQAVAPAAASDVRTASGSTVEQGRYLAHGVALCVQCHSQRDGRGRLIEDRLFQGGPIPFKNPWAGPRWAFQAPNIANLPGYTEAELVRLLTTGIRPRGDRPASPMPQFRMSPEDAKAVWSFLKSPRLEPPGFE